MKHRFIYLLTILTITLLFSACAMPMMHQEGAEHGEMAHDMADDTMAMDDAMADLPEIVAGQLTVANVQANLAMPSTTGSLWMVILNGTDTDDALIGADIPGCGVIELHEMIMQNDVMVMQQVEGGTIPVPAGERVLLKRGGLHVMCIEKEAPREVGSTVDIVLHFANAGDIAVTAPVVDPGEMNMNQGAMGNGEMGSGEMGKGNMTESPAEGEVSESETMTNTGE